MNYREEKLNLLKTMVEGIENVNLYIDDIANKFYEGEEKIACEGVAFVAEELQWIFKGLDLISDIVNTDEINTNISEQLSTIVEGMENEDYILVGDIFNYEVKPLLEELIENLRENI